MSLKYIRNIVLIGGAAALGLKAIILTTNDDWDSVTYPIVKLFKKKEEKKPHVVVLGTGWGAMSFLQKIDRDQFDITLVSPRSFFFYTPLLAGTATGTVAQSSITEPIRHYFDARVNKPSVYIQGECVSVDPRAKRVTCQIVGGSSEAGLSGSSVVIDYDHLIVAVGAEVNTFGIPGVKEHTIYMKEIEDGMNVQREILQRLETASALSVLNTDESLQQVKRLLHWVVIGGGPTGVELTAELTDFILQEVKQYFPHLSPHLKVTLLEATDKLLGMFDANTSVYARKCLEASGANVLTNAAVTKITNNHIEMRVKDPVTQVSNQTMQYGLAVWAGGIATRPVVRAIATEVGNAVQNSRFGLLVDGKMRVKGISDGSMYALGDCAVSGVAPTAQAANQQGKYLGRLFRDTGGVEERVNCREDFRFQHKGSLAYLGGMKGVAEIRGGFPEFKSFGRLWDVYLPNADPSAVSPAASQEGKIRIEGNTAFAIWRSLYFSTILSTRNQLQVLFDWIKVITFGRSITTPTMAQNKAEETVKKGSNSESNK